jgi:hypothetical protein
VKLVFYERRYGISHKWEVIWEVINEVYRRGGNMGTMDIKKGESGRGGGKTSNILGQVLVIQRILAKIL